MRVTPQTVRAERDYVRERADTVVPLIDATRSALGEAFDAEFEPVSPAAYRAEVDAVFADGDRAVNVAALVALLRDLDVVDDYPGFVVDEQLGRLLASTIAGGQPLATLAEATFHYADTHVDGGGPPATGDTESGDSAPPDAEPAGVDDLDAALAAGFQTRLPGWEWTETASPFAVE
ncbi:hypothetical protein RYH80_11205 [Halobaculum sp. MBLA0147]|uniref:hypothetical protein n=1 Tax=Halobaculum sp. MBLA0147 TaxID=3079934 RepID=UPI00352588A4